MKEESDSPMLRVKGHRYRIVDEGRAVRRYFLEGLEGRPVTAIGTERILEGFDETVLEQAFNTRSAPGVVDLILNPDAHAGYGAPVGSVLVSPSHVYPGPVGVDIKCSMSLLQLDLPGGELAGDSLCRRLIRAIEERIPTGAGKGQRSVPKGRPVNPELGRRVVVEGASADVLSQLGVPPEWARRCEDAIHRGHDGTAEALGARLERLLGGKGFRDFAGKISQLGSYGGGNHFGECNEVCLDKDGRARAAADLFGLRDGHMAFLSHCGSRGFGYQLARGQFAAMEEEFRRRRIPHPAGDRQLVHAAIGTPHASAYLDDMALAANFATVNHLLINALVLEAFREVIPGVTGNLVYFISHNIARREEIRGRQYWVHRKGATRAFPARHPGLLGTPFHAVGHPILLPGNPLSGSAVMVAEEGAELTAYSVNHGAGRAKGRRRAKAELNQAEVDAEFRRRRVLCNCRVYPLDEAPAAYKDFEEVLHSVKRAGLASEVARLRARFVIKDGDKSLGGAA